MVEAQLDPAMLPLPQALQNPNAAQVNDSDYPVEFLSVIFNQREANQVLRISKKAITPMWLTRNMYKKLPSDVKFELGPIDTQELQRRYAAFEQALNSKPASAEVNALKQKASQMYTMAFQ